MLPPAGPIPWRLSPDVDPIAHTGSTHWAALPAFRKRFEFLTNEIKPDRITVKEPAKTIEEVKAILKEHKAEVIQKYRVREIGIFGSFVRGEQKRRSDVDILVEFDPRNIPGLLKLIEMEVYLEKLLRTKVDVVIKSGIRPEFKKGILKEVVYI
jgi:hypothetical protein